jgi:hypothetical protein
MTATSSPVSITTWDVMCRDAQSVVIKRYRVRVGRPTGIIRR